MTPSTQIATQHDVPAFVEDTTVPQAQVDTVGGRLATSVAKLKTPLGTPAEVFSRLELPPPKSVVKSPPGSQGFLLTDPPIPSIYVAPKSYQNGSPKWTFRTEEGEITLVIHLRRGTWESGLGNSRTGGPSPEVAVQGVEVSGPDRLAFAVPKAAMPFVGDCSGAPRHLSVWDDFTYFEQGNSMRGWTVTRWTGRSPLHCTVAEQTALEDAILALVGPLAEGVDIQLKLAKEFADKRIGDTPLYDFGVGQIDVTIAGHMAITWGSPTKVPRIFDHFGVRLLRTHFADNAGQLFSPIELENMTLFPVDYFILDPEAREAVPGSAADASFRAMSFGYRAGQSRSTVNNSGPLKR